MNRSPFRQAGKIFFSLFFSVGLAATSWGDSLTLQQGATVNGEPYTGTSDLLIVEGTHAGRNYGMTQSLWIGSGPDGDDAVRRSLIRFDLAALGDRPITGATLILHCAENTGSPDWAVYQVKTENAGWIEGRNAIGKAEQNVSSWSHRINYYQDWIGGPGLGEPGAGYEAEPLFSSREGEQGGHGLRATPGEPLQISIPREVIEQWRQDGGNGGVLLRVVEEGAEGRIRFLSADATKESVRPVLEIQFSEN